MFSQLCYICIRMEGAFMVNMSLKKIIVIIVLCFVLIHMFFGGKSKESFSNGIFSDNTFRILSSTSTESMDKDIIENARKKGIDVTITHLGDLEIVDKLNADSSDYDAVWLSNSIWLYMLDNNNLTIDSKSIAIDPAILGITKSKAEELGFVGKDVYNRDILNAIQDGKLKYVMASVTKTNTGATTFLSFLNSLAGSPEVLTEEMVKDEELGNNLKSFFKGVERVSGNEEYLTDMFMKGDYNAIYTYESSLIDINKKLVKESKEPLYLIYPVDGVAINDMPFAYINNNLSDENKKEMFETVQSYLRSDEAATKMEEYGYRSWYGGVKENTDKKTFNPSWGIDTTKYLKDMKYPSKKVINQAFDLYIEKIRKPTHVVFCLDISGSMIGSGINELRSSMNYILDSNLSSKDKLQFSDSDKITVITFNNKVSEIFDTKYGNQTNDIINKINELNASGGTNIYSPSVEALKILKNDNPSEYTRTVILMTDGQSNSGSLHELKNYYERNKMDIPIYSITFGSSSEYELNGIADLTNARVFNGKTGLKEAFALVRSYN